MRFISFCLLMTMLVSVAQADLAQGSYFFLDPGLRSSEQAQPLYVKFRLHQSEQTRSDELIWVRLLKEFHYAQRSLPMPEHSLEDFNVRAEVDEAGDTWLVLVSHAPVDGAGQKLLIQVRQADVSEVLSLEVPAASVSEPHLPKEKIEPEADFSFNALSWAAGMAVILIAVKLGAFKLILKAHVPASASPGNPEHFSLIAGEADLRALENSDGLSGVAGEQTAVAADMSFESEGGMDSHASRNAASSAPDPTVDEVPLGTRAEEADDVQHSEMLEPEISDGDAAESTAVDCLHASLQGERGMPPQVELQSKPDNDEAAELVHGEVVDMDVPGLACDEATEAADAAEVPPCAVEPCPEDWFPLESFMDTEALLDLYKHPGEFRSDLQILAAGIARRGEPDVSEAASDTLDRNLERLVDLYQHVDDFSSVVNEKFGVELEAKPSHDLSLSVNESLASENIDCASLGEVTQTRLAQVAVIAMRAGDDELGKWLLSQLSRRPLAGEEKSVIKIRQGGAV